jgi:hypothetical protein
MGNSNKKIQQQPDYNTFNTPSNIHNPYDTSTVPTTDLYQAQFKEFYTQKTNKNILINEIYSAFNKVYGNLEFTKVRNTKINDIPLSVYYSFIDCMLCIEKRYIILIAPIDMLENGQTNKLEDIKWISFQTRTFKEIQIDLKPQPLPTISFEKLSDQERKIMKEEFDLTDKKKKNEKVIDRSVYIAKNLPLRLDLLHRNKNSTEYDYANTVTLIAALETYNCTVNLM